MAQKGDVCFDLAQCFYEKYGNPGQFTPIKIVYMCTAELIISKQGLANYFETIEGSLNSKINTNYTEM